MARRGSPPDDVPVDRPTREDLELGRRLKSARNAARRTQHDVGALFGISHQQISKYEKGASSLPVWMLLRIASYLGVPADRLLPGSSPAGFAETHADFDSRAAASPDELKAVMQRLVDLWPEASKRL